MASSDDGIEDRAMPTCVVVDDHEAVLDSVSAYLRAEGFDIVGTARTAADATHLLAALKPDVAVIDYRLGDSSGVQLARALSVASPTTATVLYSGQVTRAIVAEAFAAGVRGAVLKESPPATLLRAISTVLSGRRFVDPPLRRAR